MSLELWTVYFAAAVGLSLTPGPNGLLALNHGARSGVARAAFTVLGGVLGPFRPPSRSPSRSSSPMRLHPAASVLATVAVAAAMHAPACAQSRSGAAVYDEVCKTCHATGELGAPKLGDAKVWKPLIREGQAMLFRTSIKGIRKMPAKWGRPDLSDLEVKRAVVYMANAGGAKWPEPAK